jgi:hypothetical protein
MPSWFAELWDLIKIVAPWLTGGLAGATLTYLLNQRIAVRKQARLSVNTEQIEYSLGASDEHFKQLRVSYKGNEFENLMLYQIEIRNISSKTISKTPFLLRLKKETEIIDQSSLIQPLDRNTQLIAQTGHECAYLWDAGELKPQDCARLRLLLSRTTPVDLTWRGDDEIDISGYGRTSTQTIERDLYNILGWLSLYTLFGSIPILSGLMQSLLILGFAPQIVNYFIRLWPLIFTRDDRIVQIRASEDSRIAVVLGPGTAHIAAKVEKR